MKNQFNVEPPSPEDYKVKDFFARQLIDKTGSELIKNKHLILIDLQGIYLGAYQWLKANKIPIESPNILGMFSSNFIEILILKIVALEINRLSKKTPGEKFVAYEDLLGSIEFTKPNNFYLKGIILSDKLKIVENIFEIELFYADVPFRDMKEHASSLLKSDLSKGLVKSKIWSEARDYSQYKDFAKLITEILPVTFNNKGFFSFYIDKKDGIKYFDEKEVDIKISIRAMDAFHYKSHSSICIVSSDQDFMAIHERINPTEQVTYHADIAKFDDESKSGKRFKELKNRYISFNGIDEDWILKLLISISINNKSISAAELNSIISLFNEKKFPLSLSYNIRDDDSVEFFMRKEFLN